MNRDKIRCFKCREYDHFANECSNLVPEDSDRESDGDTSSFPEGTIALYQNIYIC